MLRSVVCCGFIRLKLLSSSLFPFLSFSRRNRRGDFTHWNQTLAKICECELDLGHTHTYKSVRKHPSCLSDSSYPLRATGKKNSTRVTALLMTSSHLWPRAFWCWWFWRHTLGLNRVWHSGAPLKRLPWETKTGDKKKRRVSSHLRFVSIKRASRLSDWPPRCPGLLSAFKSLWSACMTYTNLGCRQQ